jgi:hypothetical protein
MGAGFCGGGPLSIRYDILHGCRIYFCRGAGFCPAWVEDFVLHGCTVFWWWAVKYSLQYPAWVQDYFCRGAGFCVGVGGYNISCMGAGFRFAWVQGFVVVGS